MSSVPPLRKLADPTRFHQKHLAGVEKDKSRLHKLTIGAWDGKEFEETDPELAHALGIAYYIGIQIGRGLKIKLPDGQPLESLHRPSPPSQE